MLFYISDKGLYRKLNFINKFKYFSGFSRGQRWYPPFSDIHAFQQLTPDMGPCEAYNNFIQSIISPI